jgi:hypothetical protein
MDITNKTQKPLNVPLPGGKRLFLGPGKTGQVSPKALEHAPLAKLLEAGEIETSEGAHKRKSGAAGSAGAHPGPSHSGGGARRQSGDR